MRGPASLDSVIAQIVAEAKTAAATPAVTTRNGQLNKLAAALREAESATVAPSYEDLYTVKDGLYGPR